MMTKLMDRGVAPRQGTPRQAERLPSNWGIGQGTFFSSHQNGAVEVATLDGKLIRGRLRGYGSYDLVIETENGEWILVFKHGLKYVRPASPKEAQKEAKKD